MYSQMSFWILSSFFQLHYSHRLQSWHPCPNNLSTTWPKKVELEEWIVHLVPQPSSSHIRTTIFCINDFGITVDFLQYWNTTNRCCPQKSNNMYSLYATSTLLTPLMRDLKIASSWIKYGIKIKVTRVHECFHEVIQEWACHYYFAHFVERTSS